MGTRWIPQRYLAQVVLRAIRDALESPAHPDSKRQDRRKRRDLERYGARILKQSSVSCSPAKKTRKRAAIKEMRARLQEERKEFASKIATRLMGRWI
jgi:hypothetical protein